MVTTNGRKICLGQVIQHEFVKNRIERHLDSSVGRGVLRLRPTTGTLGVAFPTCLHSPTPCHYHRSMTLEGLLKRPCNIIQLRTPLCWRDLD